MKILEYFLKTLDDFIIFMRIISKHILTFISIDIPSIKETLEKNKKKNNEH